jgi:3-hydroxyisobutyrate dehydrogenase
MGALMAERLVRAGVPLAVADISAAALQPFADQGLPTSARGAELPGEVVMTMLPTGAHVREALLGEGGACKVPRRLVIDMSTASPEGTVELGGNLGDLGIALLDAPVSGGMAGARDGTLTAMVGGDPEVFLSARPLLAHFCSDVTRVGPLGSGHIVKALNNFLSSVTLWSTSEALAIGTRLGLDPSAMLEVWTKGSGRSHASEVKLPRHVLTRTFDFGQTLELFCKDIAIAADLAARTGVATPALDRILENWRSARDQLGGGEDITRVAELLEQSRR